MLDTPFIYGDAMFAAAMPRLPRLFAPAPLARCHYEPQEAIRRYVAAPRRHVSNDTGG